MDNKKQIELYENTNQLLNASIDKITVELIKKRSNGEFAQTVIITGCTPLVGTTTVSIGIAIAMASTGRKTLLVDCDVRKESEYKKLNDNAKKGLANYISQKGTDSSRLEDILYETNIDNLFYTPCGTSVENPTRILCSGKMDDFFENVKHKYDFVIYDFPSLNVVPDARIMFGKCDGIILVSALGTTRKTDIRDARRLIEPFLDRYYGMIVNKTPLDIYKSNVKNYDYYLLDRNGKQKFEKNSAYRKKTEKSKGKKTK